VAPKSRSVMRIWKRRLVMVGRSSRLVL
jgi:hypothetical protein